MKQAFNDGGRLARQSGWSAIGCIALLLGSASVTSAQSATLNRFSASETPEDDWHISRPTDLGHLRFGAQIHLDYANDPLVFEEEVGDSGSESARIVGHQFTGTVGLSLGIKDRLVIYAGLPIVLVQNGDDMPMTTTGVALDQADGAGLGDAYLGARVRLYGEADDAIALGLQFTATFPTAGSGQLFRGDEFLSLHPELLVEVRPGGGSRLNLNVGARIRENARGQFDRVFSDELTFGLGFAVPVWTDDEAPETHLDIQAQIYGASGFDDFFGRESTALEALLGGKFFHQSGIVAGLAAGPGLTRGYGSPDIRVLGMIGYRSVPEAEEGAAAPGDRDGDGILDPDDECVDQPEDVDTYQDEDGCPDPDNDGDGILDSSDECPLEPETVNGVDDADGCPDEVGDQDGDGILDNVDECPTDAEDMDEFEDENGCPDPDNDGDGVLDGTDECPMVAGVVENRGCPDADRDGDTVVDRLDNCPDEPGTVANQGCRRRQQVRIEGGHLEILDKVYFRTNRDVIQRRSHALLRNVAQVLNNHPEITRIRVEGHTDARGDDQANLDLSQRRAQAVVAFLVTRGEVDAGRLEARGFGETRPIVADASTPAEHAQNRRVEFNIPQTEGVSHQNSAAGADTIDH